MSQSNFKTELFNILEEGLKDPRTFEQANKMYQSMFRSAPYKASELCSMMLDDYSLEEFCEYFKSEFDVDYNPELLVCELCNYKGEGEDYMALYENVKHLPVFVDKKTSYNMF
jgi:hypothetical protein